MNHRLPPGACNAHCHVFGPRERFPYAQNASLMPTEDAPKDALYALNARLGFTRCVVVQSACHGTDNRVTEDAVLGRRGAYRGIALLPTNVPDIQLHQLDAAGFRGVRFNYMGHLGRATPIDEVLALAQRIEPLGWHLQLHGAPAMLNELGPALRRSPVPVVIDHIGRIDARLGLDQPDFTTLCRLMDDSRFWVKLSGIDRITGQGPPYDDALPYAARLMATHGDRVVWGNDWPHPNHAGPVPDEDQLVAAIARFAPGEADRQRLLVDNPQRLYRFEDNTP